MGRKVKPPRWVTIEEVRMSPPLHLTPAQIDLIEVVAEAVKRINEGMQTAAHSMAAPRLELLRKVRATLLVLKAVRKDHPFLRLKCLSAVERDLRRLEAEARLTRDRARA